MTKSEKARRSALVDEMGPLAARIEGLKAELGPLEKQVKEMKAEVASWMDGVRGEEAWLFKGARFVATVSARDHQRVITNMAKVQSFLGVRKFMANCKIALGYLDSELTAEQRAEVLTEGRTGPRTVTVEPRV